MSHSDLPKWYPLQPLKGGDLQIELSEKEIEQAIQKRVDLLTSDGDKSFEYLGETKEEARQRALEERKAFVLLKMGVCMDPKLSAWLTEVEGDLFEERFMKATWRDKQKLLDELFPKENLEPIWLHLDDLSEHLGVDLKNELKIREEDTVRRTSRSGMYRGYTRTDVKGVKKIIGLDFRYASYVIKNHRAILYKGWVIASVEKLSATIKNRFEDLLNQDLIDYAERIESRAAGPIKRLAQKVNEKLRRMVRTKREYEISQLEIEGTYEEHMDMYPPCIQDLLNQVNNVGYIGHWERFQLGLFLKHTGMPVEDQLEFWFNKAVDNINISFKEFKKKAGYVIRHIYGLEGSKIDYDMPSCNTIQNKMYCTFRHQTEESINERIKDYMQSQEGESQAIKLPMAQSTSKLAAKGRPNLACAKYLELTTGRSMESMYHPLAYLREAARAKGKLKDMKKHSSDSEDEDEKNEDIPSNKDKQDKDTDQQQSEGTKDISEKKKQGKEKNSDNPTTVNLKEELLED